jgi:hypothetical protein
MATLSSKDDLIEYALRKLGKPVVQINVDYQQCQDRIDEALLFFSERHFDGVEKGYFKYQLTQTDIDRKYIETNDIGPINGITGDSPDGRNIVSVVKVFQFGNFTSIDMFDIRYQLALTDYFGINRGLAGTPALGLATYDSTKKYVKLIQDFFQPEKAIRFSKVTNRLYIDGYLDDITPGQYIIVEAYASLDPEKFTEIWNDRWLQKYSTALIKKQWGTNMAKYDGVLWPGGITMKGSQIYAEAINELAEIENEFYRSYELPVDFMMG